MKSLSQNGEDIIALQYFGNYKGNLLEIGANNGIHLSNSKVLIDNGWGAVLVEPSGVYGELNVLHSNNPKVFCFNVAIGNNNAEMTFYESGSHVLCGDDRALVSSLDFEETLKWRKSGVHFEERTVKVIPFKSLPTPNVIDLISIDTEGADWDILQQIDLKEVGCKMLIIEWNGLAELELKFTNYCEKFGLKEIHRNRENIIYAI